MKILILGDVHCYWSDLNITIARAIHKHPDITHIVQLGDFGYGWSGIKPFKFSKAYFTDEQLELLETIPCMFLDGNHENHDLLDADGGEWQPGWTYMSRGSVLEYEGLRMLFMGGASSIDKSMRTEGQSWWSQESITYGQIQSTLENVDGPIDAIFSHDHPSSFPYREERYDDPCGEGDRKLLDVLREHYRPRFSFFGHHHVHQQGEFEGTKWHCGPIIEDRDYIIWDGYNSWLEKQ